MHLKRKIFGILIFTLLLSSQSFASHLLGGEIIWECLPSGQYRFTLTLYRDCTGATLGTGGQTLISNSPAGNIPCAKIATNYINKECGALPCASLPNGYIGGIEQHVYRSAPVTLTGTPPAAGWSFAWNLCCRPGTVTNLSAPSGQAYTLRAFMYPFTPPGSTSPLPANPCYDASPDFLEAPDVTVCTGFDAEYLSLGFDSDLDSLYYDWAQPLRAGTSPLTFTPVNWQTPYAFNNPLPTTVQNSQNVPATLNNSIGQISFKSFTQGSFATCVSIKEYRYGQLIGEVFRDIPIFVKPCPPPTGLCGGNANNAPSFSFGWYPGFDTLTPVYVNGKLSYYEMTVFAKTQVKFKLTSQDVDLQPNCVPQEIAFIGQGGNLSPLPNYNNANNCFFQAPCATINSLNSGGGFISSLNNDVEFNWQTTCDHLTYTSTLGGTAKNTYEFYFRFEDNACPLPATSYATVKINVLNYPPTPPDLSTACLGYLPNGDVQLNWIPPADTGIQFDYYKIFRSNNGGNYMAIDSVYDYSMTTYTDVNPPAGSNAYYMRTHGGCVLVSEPSDTLMPIDLTLVATPPPPNSSIANLSWNARSVKGTQGESYEVWRRVCGTPTWELVSTTLGLSYVDTVNVCGACLEYEVRVDGICASTRDSAYLSDQSNTDIRIMDSVSVVGGIANISWDTTGTASDVTDYLILKKDANGSWIQIAQVPRITSMPYVYTGSSANTESESFKVVSIDSCGNQSSDLNATKQSTIFMSINSDPCDAFVRIRWNTYKTWPQSAVSKYEVFADITPPGGPTQNRVLIYQGTVTDSVFNHTSVQSGYEYCYYIKVTDTTGLYTSTSNRKCVTSLVVQKSRLLYTARTTVKSDESIEVWTFIDKDADVIDYGIERAENRTGPYVVLGRIPKPVQGPWEVKYSDYGASSSSKRYFYRVVSQDSCGAVDTISNIGRNILLDVYANGNLTNTLVWNPYEEWAGKVGRYEVYRQVDDNGAWTLVTDALTADDTTFVDNVRMFSDSKGAFCYYVQAVEDANPLGFVDEFGNPISSRSNNACVTHNARVFVPSAFNPDSETLENRVWKPTNVFARSNSYQMYVMNRWGEKVFQTTNVDEGWDGTYKGEPQPLGVYTYYINYRSLEGLPIEERGNFTLYRNGASN